MWGETWVCDQGMRFSAPSPRGPPPSYATDLVVCVALGCDMFDCVFPTRTAVRPWARGTRGLGVGEAEVGVGPVRMETWLTSLPLLHPSPSALAPLWCPPGTCS